MKFYKIKLATNTYCGKLPQAFKLLWQEQIQQFLLRCHGASVAHGLQICLISDAHILWRCQWRPGTGPWSVLELCSTVTIRATMSVGSDHIGIPLLCSQSCAQHSTSEQAENTSNCINVLPPSRLVFHLI